MFLDAARVAPEKAVLRPALPMLLRPGWIGTNMGKLSYREQLMHPNWQRKRLEVMEAASFKCECCGDGETTLNVHHKRYVKGRMAWEYSSSELQCLCQPCHEQQHDRRELLELLLCQSEMTDDLAIGLIGGYLYAALALDDEIASECATAGGEFFWCGAIAEIVNPTSKVTWGQIAAAVRALYSGHSFNPGERSFLEIFETMDGPPSAEAKATDA